MISKFWLVASLAGDRVVYLREYNPNLWGTWRQAIRFSNRKNAEKARINIFPGLVVRESEKETDFGPKLRLVKNASNLRNKKKTARRKNPVGGVKPKGFIIASFAPVYNEILYALDSNGKRMDFRKTNAKQWKTLRGAKSAAIKISNGWGEPVIVAPVNTSIAQIESYFPKARKRVKK